MNTPQATEDHCEEYKMIREEIMAYMDKLQTVRNMMFVAVAAMMALAYTKENAHPLTALLPIPFILSSYSCATNYWISVRKAAAYLVIYHESSPSCPFRWESRHNMFKKQESRPWILRILEGKMRERRSVALDITNQLYVSMPVLPQQ